MKRVYFIVLFFLCCVNGDTFAQWTIGPSLPTGRVHPGAATVNHKIYVIGGFDGGPTAYNLNEAFDSTTGSWSAKTPMTTGRGRLAVSVGEGDSIIYAVGGHTAQNTVEAYNINTDSWANRASVVQGRLAAVAGFINGKLYVAGGTSFDTLNTLEEYTPGTNTWAFKTRMPTPRYGLAGGVIGNKFYVVGGTNSYTGGPALGTLEVYDPATNTWATKAGMPVPLSGMSASVIGGRLYVVGGFGGIGAGTTFEVYDTLTDSWMILPSHPCSRGDLTSGVIDNKFYAIAGTDAPGGTVYDTVEIFNIGTLDVNGTQSTHVRGNYPNPCDRLTTVYFEVSTPGFVSVKVYDINGQVVMTPLSSYVQAGPHNVEIRVADMPAGIYYYHIETSDFTETKKMMVLH